MPCHQTGTVTTLDGIRRVALITVVLAITALCLLADAHAQGVPAEPIEQVRVEGTQRIEPSTVVSFLTIRAGEPLTQEALDASLKALFATGLFADVVLRREENTLVVEVVENPIINRISFEGNSRIDDEVLAAEVQLRPRVVFTRTRVQNDVARLLELYRRSGRFAATVEPKVVQLPQNRVDLIFEIEEGPLTGVQRISFIGNNAFSDAELRDIVQTEESRFWKIFASEDTYDPDRLAFDRELLRRFYLSEGYADFRVVSGVAELTPDREDFFITFTLDEGERYKFGDIEVVSLLPNLEPSALEGELTTAPDDWYSSEAVEVSINNLTEAAGDLQFAFVDVQPIVSRNREERLINVTYQLNEGPRVFVERIDITGNVRTVDRVIRREFELVEGDPFSNSKLRQSETQVRNLGYFERVEVSSVPGSTADRTVVEVDVEEQSTGEFSIGAGFSSSDGPLGDVSLRERNLLGRGQDLRLSATISGRTQELDLSFTEPFFLERDLSAGFDVFRISRDNQDESSFDELATGLGLRLGYPLSERLRQIVRYRLAFREISEVGEDASLFIQEQEGETLTSAVSHQLTYDQLDSRIQPTDGYILRFGNEIAGLGGDVRYLESTIGGSIFFPVLEQTVLSLSAEGGYIVGLGDDVRINDRFFVGGNNLRGFDTSGIGPRDENGDALGGNRFVAGSVELSFPVGLPEELGVRGRTFTDFGTLSEVDLISEETAEEPILEEGSFRVSVGAGVSWSSPFGPIRVDFAVPIVSEEFDEEENFRFSFGTSF